MLGANLRWIRESKILIRLTLNKPEISACPMGHLARKGFSLARQVDRWAVRYSVRIGKYIAIVKA